jgi:hypothetical protein
MDAHAVRVEESYEGVDDMRSKLTTQILIDCWICLESIGKSFWRRMNSMENRGLSGEILFDRVHLIVEFDSSESQFRLESLIIVFEIVMKIS